MRAAHGAGPDASREAMPENGVERLRLVVTGAVQGVGFRPFVARLARELGVTGYVQNTGRGVVMEAQGRADVLARMVDGMREGAPAGAVIGGVEGERLRAVAADRDFVIRDSTEAGPFTAVAPVDVAVCAECLAEVGDPRDRRYQYAFTTCTGCGPRYSILLGLPYDRARTTMAGFTMCRACAAEYGDGASRRFHAQTNGCPACGPRLALWDSSGGAVAKEHAALEKALDALRSGAIVAVKGLGGFHLMVDARDGAAVRRLRARKHRPQKPLAVLFADLARARQEVRLSAAEAALLGGAAAPIVLVERRQDSSLAAEVGPEPGGVPEAGALVGALLAYTPLHWLLARGMGAPLVATSGNLAGEPICTDESQAVHRLAGVADWFLVHDRPIARPVDDSVARIIGGKVMLLRCARGYAPLHVTGGAVSGARVPAAMVAVGGQQKAAVALGHEGGVVLGQHLGDLDTAVAVSGLAAAMDDTCGLFGARAQALCCDAHPDYASTRVARGRARQRGGRVYPVQHHYAHVRACMAEHGLTGPVLGVAWDGTGYGTDGTIWGGEFIRVGSEGWQRLGHLRQFPLPGGDAAAREPRRAALGVLFALHGRDTGGMEDLAAVAAFTDTERAVLLRALEHGVNAPWTSSAGRLFDAAAALLGLVQRCSFEGQAAMALEGLVDPGVIEGYELALVRDGAMWVLDWRPLVAGLVADIRAGVSRRVIAARFHNGLAEGIAAVAAQAGEARVVLSGGCFQNRVLSEAVIERLVARGHEVYWPGLVPGNDGGLAVGQVMAALVPMTMMDEES